jgi:hypothetical protein
MLVLPQQHHLYAKKGLPPSASSRNRQPKAHDDSPA